MKMALFLILLETYKSKTHFLYRKLTEIDFLKWFRSVRQSKKPENESNSSKLDLTYDTPLDLCVMWTILDNDGDLLLIMTSNSIDWIALRKV